MKKVVSITDMLGNSLPLEKMDIKFIGEDYVIASFKGYGFTKRYASCDGYTVKIEK